MDMLLLLLSFAVGYWQGGDRPSPPPPVCPPIQYPQPPAELMAPPPTLYLVPGDLRPKSSLQPVPPSAPD